MGALFVIGLVIIECKKAVNFFKEVAANVRALESSTESIPEAEDVEIPQKVKTDVAKQLKLKADSKNDTDNTEDRVDTMMPS